MALKMTGEVLAVTSENVSPKPGQSFEAFVSRKVLIFDEGNAVELTIGRDFPGDQFRQLLDHRDDRPQVELACSAFKGRFYADRLLTLMEPAKSAK